MPTSRESFETASTDIDATKLEIDVLLHDSDDRRAESNKCLEAYYRNTRAIQFYVTTLATLVSVLIYNVPQGGAVPLSKTISQIQSSMKDIFGEFFLFAAAVLLFFLLAERMDLLCQMYMSCSRIAAVEQQINKLLQKKILLWESEIMPSWLFFARPALSLQNNKGWVHPIYLLGVWFFVSAIATVTALCYLSYVLVPAGNFAPLFSLACVALLGYHLAQWILLHTVGVSRIRTMTFKLSSLEQGSALQIDPAVDSISASTDPNNRAVGWATFCGGFLFFLVSAALMGDLTAHKGIDYPLLYSPSIWLGDSLLLPAIAILSRSAIKNFHVLGPISKSRRYRLIAYGFVSLIGSAWLHWTWAHDPYLGFLDPVIGVLSFAGWWHLFFTAIQSTLFLYISDCWVSPRLKGRPELYSQFSRVWMVITLFSFISVVDNITAAIFVKTLSLTLGVIYDATLGAPSFISCCAFGALRSVAWKLKGADHGVRIKS